jgi:TonB family protein
MSETWKRWEGQVVNGEFPLVRYLGGSDHSAVFLTERRATGPEKAAIKLIPANPDSAESQLRRWKQSAGLVHPHLVRLFESGRCELEGTPLLFVVMEAAEEDLSQILPERALSPDEVRQLLPPVLDALAHLHGEGLVHGRLRPSNILAAGDQVKVSADTLRAGGEQVGSPNGGIDGYEPPEAARGKLTTAADAWSLAVTLVEVLTQRRPTWDPAAPGPPQLPPGVPEPFLEIARRCLRVDPQQRWTIAEVAEGWQPKPSKPAAVAASRPPISIAINDKKKPPVWVYALGLIAAVAVIALIVMAVNKSRSSSSDTRPVEVQPQGKTPATALPEPSASPAEMKSSAAAPTTKASSRGHAAKGPEDAVVKGAVLQQVLPRVSASARHTIEGKIKVGVRVKVDASGKVTEAKLVSAGPSQYFARLALEAAREWKFTPPQVQGSVVASDWILHFGFRRSGTDVVSTQTAP